jgi:hypothetical protein
MSGDLYLRCTARGGKIQSLASSFFLGHAPVGVVGRAGSVRVGMNDAGRMPGPCVYKLPFRIDPEFLRVQHEHVHEE